MLPYQRAKIGVEHVLDIEKAFMLGEKKLDTTGTQGHPRRATGGVLEFIEAGNSYVQNQGGPLTAPDMETFLREGFTYGDSTKILMCGGLVLSAINEIARGQLQTRMDQSTYGVKISQWQTAFGNVNIVNNSEVLKGAYAGYAFLLDMNCFVYRYIPGRDTVLRTNVETPGQDGVVDEYLTECGLQRMQASRCALLKGITS